MTELEQARAHLRYCQQRLWKARGNDSLECALYSLPMRTEKAPKDELAQCECAVLAALSWVWDAQQRQPIDLSDIPEVDEEWFRKASIIYLSPPVFEKLSAGYR